MKDTKYSKEFLKQLYENLLQISYEYSDTDFGNRDTQSFIWMNYSLATSSGKKLYESLSDEQLISVLCHKAKQLGYSPSQKQMFWVWREYIKLRFKKWTYALKTAQLPPTAGKGGKTIEQANLEKQRKELMFKQVREKALSLGRIPHPRELPNVCLEMKKYMKTWSEVIEASGVQSEFILKKNVHKIEDLEPEYIKLLDDLNALTKTLGRSPIHGEVDSHIKLRLIQRCGSWRNALYQIGLEPVMRINPFYNSYLKSCLDKKEKLPSLSHSNMLYDCYYKVLNLSEEDKIALAEIEKVYKKMGQVPDKKEIPTEIRKKLLVSCGSWSNILFQIGLAPINTKEK